MAAAAGAGAVVSEEQLKKYNRILNILDPPKDLNTGVLKADYRDELTPLLVELFWPDGTKLPDGFDAVKDTKKSIKKLLGGEKADENGPYRDFIRDKANSLYILQNTTTSGYNSAPSGLFVAQDAGPVDVVSNPTYLITPGTVLDPASKDKNGIYFTQPGNALNTLPLSYIQKLNLDNVIVGNIKIEDNGGIEPDRRIFSVTIPVQFKDIKNPKEKKRIDITANLLGTTFKPAALGTADWFLGNPAKAEYIKTNRKQIGVDSTITDNVRKFLLIKELGDTLQVQWLNYIFDTNRANKASDEMPNKGNTVIITNDNVVFYRAIVNGVAVILTYEGVSKFYRAFGETDNVMVTASMIKKIREEAVAHNEAIIKTIQAVAAQPSTGPPANKWALGTSWTTNYAAAKKYLEDLAKHLEVLNKDLDRSLKIAPSIDAASEIAKQTHFLCPFVWVKSEGHYKTINKVVNLLQGGRGDATKFQAVQFRPEKFASPDVMARHFVKVGGRNQRNQRGGARRTLDTKTTELGKIVTARKAGTITESEMKDAILAFLSGSITEFAEPLVADPYVFDPEILQRTERANSKSAIVGVAANFLNPIWKANVTALHGAERYKADLVAAGDFFYVYVQDFFPEVFIYAYAVKSVGIVGYDWVTADLGTKYTVDHSYDEDDGKYINITYEGDVEVFSRLHPRINHDESVTATLQAIKLARILTNRYPVLLRQKLADFLAYMSRFPAAGEDVVLVENVGLEVAGLRGGGKGDSDLVADIAIDNYEIFYSLQIKAAYEHRTVTEEEFQEELDRVTRIVLSEMKPNSAPLSDAAAEMALESPLFKGKSPEYVVGGRRKKYRKTQKKRSKKQKRTHRKTRKQK